MAHVFPRQHAVALPKAVASDGCYIIDENGKQYLDGSGGAAVSCLGHGDAEVIAAIQRQTEQMAFAHTGFFTSEPAEQLADLLIKNAPAGLDRVYFVSGGSEAMEAALKLARQFHLDNGEPSRKHIIARQQSYHGNTLGALATGGNVWRRKPFEPLLIEVSHIAPCYEYRHRHDGETAFEYGQRAAQELEDEILRLGAENVCAFVAETVVGATLGVVPAVNGYFKRIREICDAHGVLLILDEVMCGMGRTGHLFACEADGVAPDILCIAKGLGAGYQPIGAMLCSARIYDVIGQSSGAFQHGHTYVGHPVACAAGLAVVSAILERDLMPKIQQTSEHLFASLRDAFGQHPHVGDIRGRGLFIGLEIVADRETKEPFGPDQKLAARLKSRAFEAGLICYPGSGTKDGRAGDHILLAPPFIYEERHADELVSKLRTALSATLSPSA